DLRSKNNNNELWNGRRRRKLQLDSVRYSTLLNQSLCRRRRRCRLGRSIGKQQNRVDNFNQFDNQFSRLR
ncbi:hypothetical protein DERF_001553, partial [Dermatophagoides farinae]